MLKIRLYNVEASKMNKDYIRGIKFLLEKSKEQGINIRNVQWVPHVSKLLSEYDLCYKFWFNVWWQNRLDRVPLCETWFDVIFDPNKCLFCWGKTYEGHSFWEFKLSKLLEIRNICSSETMVSSRWLRD